MHRRPARSRTAGPLRLVPALLLTLAACTGGEAAQDAAPPASEAGAVAAEASAAEVTEEGGPAPGKYGCAESIPRMVGGSYEYQSEGRGFVTLERGGRYTDPAGVAGTFRHDAAAQETRFAGGALDGAVATPLEGEGPRLWVVIPTESGERRWSCSLV